MSELSIVGKSIARIDAKAKVTGEQVYVNDVKLPGMLYGVIVRSPYAHARILEVETSEAEAVPGVRAVITSRDTPGIKFSFIPSLADKLPLESEKVRYVGDEVAAVAADTLEIAQKAAKLVKVRYQPLPAVFDPEEAMSPEAPRIHENKESNVVFEIHKEFGNKDAALKAVDYFFEDRFVTPRVCHCCMETRGCIAYFDRAGQLTVWSPTQAPHTLRQELSRVLGMDIGRIRVLRVSAGGAFGSRLVMDMKEPIAAILSQRTGRPVKIINTRGEEFTTAKTRYPYIIDLRTGVTRDGKIMSREARIIVDNGAYTDKGSATLNFAASFFIALYEVPYVKYDGYLVYTNNQFGTAFRGFGNPQIHFAIESQMDIIAEKLGLDPMELRLRNANQPNRRVSSGAQVTSCGLEACIRGAAELSNWESKRVETAKQDPHSVKRRGIGMAVMTHSGGGSRYYGYNATDAFVKISDDAKVTVITPAVEIGQGAATAMAQIAAEVLGVNMDRIVVENTDTNLTPYDLGAFGSRTTFVCGNAVRNAALDARREMAELAGELLGTEPELLSFKDERISARQGERWISFQEVVDYAYKRKGRPISGRGRYDDPVATQVGLSEGTENHIPTYAFACQVAEVEVDLETGEVRVLRMTAAHDTGTTINPAMASGQVEGGVVQGIGFALTERYQARDGKMLNDNFLDYKLPRAGDSPPVDVLLVESNDPEGPFGAKGIGEPGLVPTAAAIANAIYDAIGARFRHIPITPEDIVSSIRSKDKN